MMNSIAIRIKGLLSALIISTSVLCTGMSASAAEMDMEADDYGWSSDDASQAFAEVIAQTDAMALVYLTDQYDVRTWPSADADIVTTVNSGITVQLRDVAFDESGMLWYWCEFGNGDDVCCGYIEDCYLAYSDELVREWRSEYYAEPSADELVSGDGWDDVKQFPRSYQPTLNDLKNSHPNWIFVKMNTGLDWNTVIAQENIAPRNLVGSNSDNSWKNGTYSAAWSIASERIIKYYMDPRNFINEEQIFQFEQLTYNDSYHNLETVQRILNGTFMEGLIPDSDKSYAEAFYEIGRDLRVSPYHLACRVSLEQGKGTSPLISGTYPGYEGLYNYYNIGASGNTNEKIYTSGLNKARSEGWTSRYESLKGGGYFISKNYILRGQDTNYLQKFDVDNSDGTLYYHQYMQNIQAAYSESFKVYRAYKAVNALDNCFVFKIPVYDNMPKQACTKPPAPEAVDEPELWDIYKDVPENSQQWKIDGIQYVYDHGLMQGFTADTFGPDEILTRAQFATILYRMAGSGAVTFSGRFADVPERKYFALPVEWCATAGVIKGYDENTFGPDDIIQRQQLATMLYRYAQYTNRNTSARADLNVYADESGVWDYAKEAVSWCVAEGIMNGKGQKDGTSLLDPKGWATRAECAAMLMRYLTK